MQHIFPVILSGGSGSRLWPLSRSLYPKQLLALTSEKTMLQETAERVQDRTQFGKPIIISNEEHRFTIASQLSEIDMEIETHILEPVGRNTAPAAVVAALYAEAEQPGSQILVLPADHFIQNPQEFAGAISRASAASENGYLATFGIVPHAPETGFGYIKMGEGLKAYDGVRIVERFVEKPNAESAVEFLADGSYCWNSGIFLFSAAALLEEAKLHCPEMISCCARALAEGHEDLDFFRLDRQAFEACPSDSIDYAIMEKTSKAVTVPVDMGWNDIGSWNALWNLSEKDTEGNATLGDVLTFDTVGSYVRSEDALIATLGVKDLVIIQTSDAVLVADKTRVQDIKSVVAHLQEVKRTEHEVHSKVYRPWGYYETLDDGTRHQVKHLFVKPGAALSLQKHQQRAEHWVVVEGSATVTVGEETSTLSENESVYIPIGTMHRLENSTDEPLRLIEVQTGTYLGEDDIERFDDVYGRQKD